MSNILGYFFHRKRFKIVIAIAIVLLVIYPLVIGTKKSFADEISLFPTICEGSWSNAAEAAGDPADNRLIGARSQAAGDVITCRSFDTSSLPKEAKITEAHFEFLWTVGNDKNIVTEPSIEESYDAVVPLTDEKQINQEIEGNEINSEKEQIIQESETEILDTEIIPSEDQKEAPGLPETNSIDLNNNDSQSQPEPTSRLPYWIQSLFIPEAQAEEQIDVPVENTKTDSLNIEAEQLPVIKSDQENVITEETQSSEVIDTIEASGDNNPLSEISSEQTENNSETEIKTSKETGGTGTSLYDITYTISDNKVNSLGEVTHEHLSNLYPVVLNSDDLVGLKVSLTSRMTFDQIDNLALEGVKLVVVYSVEDSLDPIRQPDLEVDTILDDIIVDDIQTIRIKRADNKQYEIWYRVLGPEELIANNHTAEKIDTHVGEPVTADSVEITNSISTDLLFDDIKSGDMGITQTEKLVIESSDEETISTPTNTIDSEIFSDPKTTDKKKRHYWNYVDGDDSVNRDAPVGLQDGYIFWLNKKATVLNSFNILTQGYNSQSYQPESGIYFIMYRSPSSQEKKAILNMIEKKFIFSE